MLETLFSWTVGDEDAGQRLDVVLVRRVPEMTRKKAAGAARQSQIQVNGRIAVKGHVLQKGDVITLSELPLTSDFDAAPDPSLPISISLETSDFVIADKPPGIPTHPLKQGENGTLSGALVARYPEMAGIGYSRREPGILHRLDTGTSGLVLAARTKKAFETLRSALRAGKIEKTYLALVQGRVDAPLQIDTPLGTDPSDERRVVPMVDRNRSVDRVTDVTGAELRGSYSLVTVSASRAGRHQIRAHLASIGHPLVGDSLYGGPAFTGLSRHFLHADSIAFELGEGFSAHVHSPLPTDLQRVLAKITQSPT